MSILDRIVDMANEEEENYRHPRTEIFLCKLCQEKIIEQETLFSTAPLKNPILKSGSIGRIYGLNVKRCGIESGVPEEFCEICHPGRLI